MNKTINNSGDFFMLCALLNNYNVIFCALDIACSEATCSMDVESVQNTMSRQTSMLKKIKISEIVGVGVRKTNKRKKNLKKKKTVNKRKKTKRIKSIYA